MRFIGELDPPNDVTGSSVHYVDVVSRTTFPCWDIEQFSVRLHRQPIDTRIDHAVPQDRIVVNVEAIDHSGARSIHVGDVEFPRDGAGSDPSDIVHSGNGLNGSDQPVPGVNVVHRNGSTIPRGLVDRIKRALGVRRHRLSRGPPATAAVTRKRAEKMTRNFTGFEAMNYRLLISNRIGNFATFISYLHASQRRQGEAPP